MSAQAYIVDALRSPTGKRKGSLAAVHGADLGAHVIKALVERNDIPAADYDDVVFGMILIGVMLFAPEGILTLRLKQGLGWLFGMKS